MIIKELYKNWVKNILERIDCAKFLGQEKVWIVQGPNRKAGGWSKQGVNSKE